MYQIDQEWIERLKDDGYDLWTIAQWEGWLAEMPALDSAMQAIESAFKNIRLGEGIGLREAQAIDDYADEAEQAAARALDEKTHWLRIDRELLNCCYAAPSFFDPQGFWFHLPAFLLAELKDEYEFGFVDRLIEKSPSCTKWIGYLNREQANAIVDCLSLLKSHPDYANKTAAIEKAIARISS